MIGFHNDIGGIAANLSQRVCSDAEPHQVLVSRIRLGRSDARLILELGRDSVPSPCE
jgi:class 3 adenylate cyclase